MRIVADRARRRCLAIFSDNGPGISATVMARLFDPFVTDKARGTGLGLALSHRIVRDHGGTLAAANRSEGGAEFCIELPCECEEERKGAAPAVFAPEQADLNLTAPIHPRTEGMHARAAHH